MIELTKEDINKFTHHLDMGALRKFVENNKHIPDETKVIVERIEDMYYNGVDISGMSGCKSTEDGIYPEGSKSKGWDVYLHKGEFYHIGLNWNKEMSEEIDRIKNGEEREYPLLEDKHLRLYTDEELKEMMSQFSPAWAIGTNREEDLILIHMHY